MTDRSSAQIQCPRTIISAGLPIRKILNDDPLLRLRGVKVYPLRVPIGVKFPYIVYSCTNSETRTVKVGAFADEAIVEVVCFSSEYTECINIAEEVRRALDGVQIDTEEVHLRSVRLDNTFEEATEDAFARVLQFRVRM